MADRRSAKLLIHKALGERDFRRDLGGGATGTYRGVLDPLGLQVPALITVTDLDFVDYPVVRLGEDYPIGGRCLPHLLGASRAVCYYASGSVVLDRYDPAGTVLQCLAQAEKVVVDALKGKLDADLEHEFGAYWDADWVLCDLPAGFSGRASLQVRSAPGSPDALSLTLSSSWLLRSNGAKVRIVPVDVVSVSRSLTVRTDGPWPPCSLLELNLWLRDAAPEAVGRLERLIETTDEIGAWIALSAPNGTYLFGMEIPKQFQKPEFLKNRRARVGSVIASVAGNVPIDRGRAVQADSAYVSARNLGKRPTLTGKRILLVGCGTIGSFLAHQLALCGAGQGAGYMTLVDDQVLMPGNMGRHLLGAPFLLRNKAEGCASYIEEHFPFLAVEAIPRDVLKADIKWGRYDLVIDATGEEALSLALNDRAVERGPAGPAHLFVWLEGNGAAAQTLLTGAPGKACLKCLKPALSGPPRIRVLRPEVEVEMIGGHGCGDGAYVPFPATRSICAASLAAEVALEWAADRIGHRHRVLTFDHCAAFDARPGSPNAHADCPACGRT